MFQVGTFMNHFAENILILLSLQPINVPCRHIEAFKSFFLFFWTWTVRFNYTYFFYITHIPHVYLHQSLNLKTVCAIDKLIIYSNNFSTITIV